MPIYEYECRACRTQFEHFVRPMNPPDPTLFAVNSEETQQQHLKQARKKGVQVARDQKHAEVETLQRIEAEHDH
jgi:putative FmdB family regulatory protein